MARTQIEQDVGSLPDHQPAGFQKRRREWRPVALLDHARHRRHAARAARDVVIRGAGIFQREPDIFATALDGRPVIQLVAHGRSHSRVPDAVRHSSCRSAEPGSTGVRYGPGSAAPRHSASKTRVNALMAKSYALRSVRGTTQFAAKQ